MSQVLREFHFQDNVTEPNNGNILLINNGTICTFSIEGTATSCTVEFEAQSHDGGKFLPCFCYTLDSSTKVVTQATTLNDVLWQLNVSSIRSFRTRIVSISGGYVNIIGTVAG